MTDTQWHERLTRLADQVDSTSFLLDDDLRRGRERLRRRRVGELSAGLLVAAVLGGGGLLLGGGPGSAGTAPRPATSATASATPTVEQPPVPAPTDIATASPHEPKPRLDHRRIRAAIEGSGSGPHSPFPRWRDDLFATTRSVLDPGGGHLNYSTDGLTGGTDQHGVGLGIKMGWRNPGRSGEGLVQVEVTTEGGSDGERCELTAGIRCPETVLVDGTEMKVGSSGSAYVVLHRQPDGDRVVVLVDRLFGNTSTRAVSGLGFTRHDVYRLVQDTRLDLPG